MAYSYIYPPAFIGPTATAAQWHNFKTREYARVHAEQRKVTCARYYRKNAKQICAKIRKAISANPEPRRRTTQRYYTKNKAVIHARIGRWVRQKYRDDPTFRFAQGMRTKTRKALRRANASKVSRTSQLLGCTFAQLRIHLESLFSPGMSWENYGFRGWHIDHVKPCVKFDLTDPLEQRICFHYTNLQPLWALDNLIKGAKYDT